MSPISARPAETRRVEQAAFALREAGLGAEGRALVEAAAPAEVDGTHHHLWAMTADLYGRGRPDTANELLETSEAEHRATPTTGGGRTISTAAQG